MLNQNSVDPVDKPQYDFLIVGAGLFGATFARLAMDHGFSCMVIDRRSHIGGNVYCEDVSGINVHKYGAHIFHTSNPEVWQFVNSIVPFNRYTNSPMAMAPDGRLYNLPFNMNTFNQLWGTATPLQAMQKLDDQRREAIDRMKTEGVDAPRNLEEQALTLIGRDIFNLLIRDYTEKQWGRPCSELPAFIIKRLPVRLTFDNNYFNDLYQGIPIGGYNPLIEGLLRGATVLTSTDFFADRQHWQSVARHIVYTGPIDEFFDYRFGHLQYRSVRFETELLTGVANFQGNAVVNYTSADVDFTRIIEHKHFQLLGNDVYSLPDTVVSREYPQEWREGLEPYYPINDSRNQALYERYAALANSTPGVSFGGRLAEYRYYDMGPLIEQVFNLWKSAPWTSK